MGRRWTRPIEEVQEQLLTQARHLRKSCSDFDAGDHTEAARLATAVSTIALDRRSQKSILTQLGIKDALRMVDLIGPYDPESQASMMPFMPLVAMRFVAGPDGSSVNFSPNLSTIGKPDRMISIDEWWNGVVFDGLCGDVLTRRQLVVSLRDQDGGGHVDPELTDEAYIGVSRENSPRLVMVYPSDDDRPGQGVMLRLTTNPSRNERQVWPGLHFSSMRAVAHELDQSLVREGLVPAP